MRALHAALFCTLLLVSSPHLAIAQDAGLDAVSERAADLEARLNTTLDGSPEAAAAMLELVDLYHAHGRVFGLVRTGQRFVHAQPLHPEHEHVMEKLLDGLAATSRAKEFITTARQFLSRYPDSDACVRVEEDLARTLEHGGSRGEAAIAWERVWSRQGPGARHAGAHAIRLRAEGNSEESLASARRLATEMLERLPAGGTFWIDIGQYAFALARRHGEWAGSNAVAQRLLESPLPPLVARSLHVDMAENHSRLGQRANAVASLKKAREIEDSQDLHSRLIREMAAARSEPGELQPLVDAYARSYPEAPDRHELVGLLASAYHEAGHPARARALLSELITHEARHFASRLVAWTGTTPEELDACEQTLLAALETNADDAAILRYVLAFDVHRDRRKDLDRARELARTLLLEPPTDGSITSNALGWLLSNEPDDDALEADVQRLVTVALRSGHRPALREALRGWEKQAKRDKSRREGVRRCAGELEKLDDPGLKDWELANGNSSKAIEARERLLQTPLTDEQARGLLAAQADALRQQSNTKRRMESIPYARKLAERFPSDYEAARLWMKTTSDHGTPDEARAALAHLLRFDPPYNDTSIYRRAILGASKTEDRSTVERTHRWILSAQSRHGLTSTYAAEIGDALVKHELEDEALAYWRARVRIDPDDAQCYHCALRVSRQLEGDEKIAFLTDLAATDSVYHGAFASWLADEHLRANRLAEFESVLGACRSRQDERPFRDWGMSSYPALEWIRQHRADEKIDPATRRAVFVAVEKLRADTASAVASLARLELTAPDEISPMARLLGFQAATTRVGTSSSGWDLLRPYAQAALARQDFAAAATLATGMLTNITNVDADRRKEARDTVSRAYSRMGAVGLAIDETSPIAPLLEAALYLRLGDRRLAREAYAENRKLFDEHRDEIPLELLLFAAETHIAAGGEENHERAEDILRGWIIRNSESEQVEDGVKSRVQLLLARNYFASGRYEVARSEFTTLLNRYGSTPEAIEAEFGIGETYLEQKVHDRAGEIFEKLARSRDRDIVIRAEFLRGVLANRRGDRDEARQIFRGVLERVPDVGLANQVLFNLAEVYGAEQRFLDQLELLNTVGRLGRSSKRWHVPGTPLSIVVQDSDLGISRGHAKIPVIVTTSPGGDLERIHLQSGGAGRGLFRVDVETRLGPVNAGDGVLEITGQDTIRVDYPEEFKAQFRFVPLADAEIRIAADARFEASSSRIETKPEETFSERLRRESRETEAADERKSQGRPSNQVKPGNRIYLNVQDLDRDLSDEPDRVSVKLVASSGDQVQLTLEETGPHTGLFEGTCPTGELPAGALASDHAIDHSPLMAIDRDRETFWQSEPDGATPKWLSVDMKDLRGVERVTIESHATDDRVPLRGRLEGSHDGRFWFTLSSQPPRERVTPLAGEVTHMTRSVWPLKSAKLSSWKELVELTTNQPPLERVEVETLTWSLAEDAEGANEPHAVVWRGWLVQPRAGALRFSTSGVSRAIVVDGHPELELGDAATSVDVWLDAGRHELLVVATTETPTKGVLVTRARENPNAETVTLAPFRAEDFDLDLPGTVLDSEKTTRAHAEPMLLLAAEARVHRETEHFGAHRELGAPQLGNWKSLEDWIEWEISSAVAAHYSVWITYAHAGPGGRFRLESGEHAFEDRVIDTGGRGEFVTRQIGVLSVAAGERRSISLRPVEIVGDDGLLELRRVELRPTERSVVARDGSWEFRFPRRDLRHVRLVVEEYVGEAVAIRHVEVAGLETEIHIPTEADVLALAGNDTLEIAAGDVVTASYTDELTAGGTQRNRVLSAELTATYFNGKVLPISYDFERASSGSVASIRKDLLRVDPGDRIVVEVIDYDMDRTGERDRVEAEVAVNDGPPLALTALETGPYTGVFRTEVDTTTPERPMPGRLAIVPGDRVFLRYRDQQNTFPGHAWTRESFVLVIEPTAGSVRIVETRYIPPPAGSEAAPQRIYLPPRADLETSGVAYEVPLTVEVIDPDAAKDSRSAVTVDLRTTTGAEVRVRCVVSSAFDSSNLAPPDIENWALHQGRFIGQVMMQLGGADSPRVVPVAAGSPGSLVGGPVASENDPDGETTETTPAREPGPGTRRVLNLTGEDRLVASYEDLRRPEPLRRPDGESEILLASGRLVADGQLAITDGEYEKEVERLHVGERLFVVVRDADLDRSDARDTATVRITSSRGEDESVTLDETLSHSGVFTGSFELRAEEKPEPRNHSAGSNEIETFFGDVLTVTYTDPVASSASGNLVVTREVPVAIGTDGLVSAFSKVFGDEKLAVETRFHIAESYFELFKSHNQIERRSEAEGDLEAGRRVLRELMEDFPDPKYLPRVAYLRGQFAQELKAWDEAIEAYSSIVREHPDHTLAADAQYKLAQCHEEAGDFAEALEAYVTLAATYPKSPLIANVMIRINEHFYKAANFEVAARVCTKFLERFESHRWASRMAFRIGQCHYKSEKYADAGAAFDRFAKLFPDDELSADALFWAGESFRMAKDVPQAFRRYNRCRWDFPESEASKYARGRLALPEMLAQFEAEARLEDE